MPHPRGLASGEAAGRALRVSVRGGRYNVSIPVMGRDFWLFERDVAANARTPIH